MQPTVVTLVLMVLISGTSMAQQQSNNEVEVSEAQHIVEQPQQEVYEVGKYPELDRLLESSMLYHLIKDELTKRATYRGFQGVRGKKTDGLQDYNNDKRAPMGFQGVRGKKNSFYKLIGDYYDKRTRMGFQGVRGKRFWQKVYGGKNELDDEDEYSLANNNVDNRPMLTTLQNVRGRRSIDYDDLASKLEKRSPYRFYSSRGKKNPNYELYNKFVGVRGKKSSQPPSRVQILIDELLSSYTT